MNHYQSVESLTTYLASLTSETWPIREVCSREDADARAELHRKIPGRVVLRATPEGYSTFTIWPAGTNKPDTWELDNEKGILIEIG